MNGDALDHRAPDGEASVGGASGGGASERGARRARARRAAVSAAVLAAVSGVVLLAWELAARRGLVDVFFVSRPSAIAWQLVDWSNGATSRGPLLRHIGVTLADAVLGLAAGSLIGWPASKIVAHAKWYGDALWLAVRLLWPAAWIALGAALALATGVRVPAGAGCAALLVFFFACSEARSRSDTRLPLGRRSTVRVRSGLSLAGAVVGECLAARDGIGFLIAHSLRQFNASGVYAAFVVLIGIAAVFELLAAAARAARLRLRPHRACAPKD